MDTRMETERPFDYRNRGAGNTDLHTETELSHGETLSLGEAINAVEVDEDRRFVCEYCNSAFRQKSHLTQHIKSVHLKEKPFHCEQCQQSFALKGDLNRHIRSVHLKERPFRCDYDGCDRSFSTARHLRRHQLIHTGEKPFACPYDSCDYQSTRLCNLYGHIRRKHRDDADVLIHRAKTKYSKRKSHAPEEPYQPVKVEQVPDNPVEVVQGMWVHNPPVQQCQCQDRSECTRVRLPSSEAYGSCLLGESSGATCHLCSLAAEPLPVGTDPVPMNMEVPLPGLAMGMNAFDFNQPAVFDPPGLDSNIPMRIPSAVRLTGFDLMDGFNGYF
ncbi:Zinc-finger double domain [Carpediemonas membranifera]|uniref:Zinc-finger double domain n=1 Tax=Carpediemonas membranifera TaxID=201153 RepID=A0A8J6BUD2_9EUKA|nr:Zinc-finger double domain [Carpediemonas membranifera]|eukprot:KAG9390231.1 Zinc-finger double domain [Carpediemonas membranifera]